MRLNVEDDLDKDPRFRALVRLLDGDDEKALGKLLRFWQAAQVRWKRGELIPEDVFVAGGWGFVLEAGLAVKRDGGVYARGAEEHFKWLASRSRAGKIGGKRSGEARRKQTQAKRSKRTRNEASGTLAQEKPPGSHPEVYRPVAVNDDSASHVRDAEGRVTGGKGSEDAASKQTQAKRSKSEQSEASASKTKPHALTHTLTQEQNPLSPPRGSKRDAEHALRDEAIRITEACLGVALAPPVGMTRAAAIAEIERRVPKAGRVVVERRVGADGWRRFVDIVTDMAKTGALPTYQAQLREAIVAELRRPAQAPAAAPPAEPEPFSPPDVAKEVRDEI